MARTVEQIQNEMLAYKSQESGLADLNSTSKVSIWRLWVYITALLIHYHERMWDTLKQNMEKLASEVVPGTNQWVHQKVLAFQYGDILQLNEKLEVTYPIINETNRIIKACSIKQQANRVAKIKVAKAGNTNPLIRLSEAELYALQAYVRKLQFAGTQLVVVSTDADLLNAEINVWYHAEYVESEVLSSLETVIEAFLNEIPFDGVLSINPFLDKLQAVEGVQDIQIETLQARNAYTTLDFAVGMIIEGDWEIRQYEAESGYYQWDNFQFNLNPVV